MLQMCKINFYIYSLFWMNPISGFFSMAIFKVVGIKSPGCVKNRTLNKIHIDIWLLYLTTKIYIIKCVFFSGLIYFYNILDVKTDYKKCLLYPLHFLFPLILYISSHFKVLAMWFIPLCCSNCYVFTLFLQHLWFNFICLVIMLSDSRKL